jgi:hypothetical protein
MDRGADRWAGGPDLVPPERPPDRRRPRADAGESSKPRWEVSFRVADADQAVARVLELDGRVLLGPIDVPVGRFAIVADPDGNPFMVTTFEKPLGGVDGS